MPTAKFRSAMKAMAIAVLAAGSFACASTNSDSMMMEGTIEMSAQDQLYPREYLVRGAPKTILPKALGILLANDIDPDLIENFVKNLGEGATGDIYTFISTQSFRCPTAIDDTPAAQWREHCLPGLRYTRVVIGAEALTSERRAVTPGSEKSETGAFYAAELQAILAEFELSSADWTRAYADNGYHHFPYPYTVQAMQAEDKLLLIKGPALGQAASRSIYSVTLFLFSRI